MAGPIRFRSVDKMLMDSFSDRDILECSQVERRHNQTMKRSRATSPQPASPNKESSSDSVPAEAVLVQSQPLSPPATPVEFGGAFHSTRNEPAKCDRVVRKLCKRIEEIQRLDNTDDLRDEIFTIPVSSTPTLGRIYEQANDGIISAEGLGGPSVIGVRQSEEHKVQKDIENPGLLHEEIVRSWGFNFNDSKFERKRNLYHVIYTGEHEDHLCLDMQEPQLLRYASHVKCKAGGSGRFSGRIHTHDLIAVSTPFNTRKANYDRDYKTVVRTFYKLIPGNCNCTRDRLNCHRCSPGTIKVKLINTTSYFINVAKYIINIYAEEQVVVGEFSPSICN